MQKSPLQLEHSAILEFSIQVVECDEVPYNGQYPSFDFASFKSSVNFESIEAEPEADTQASDEMAAKRFRVGLKLELAPSDDEPPRFPYRIRFVIGGLFEASQIKDDRRDVVTLVNGASMLYATARDFLLTTTSRCAGPQLLLPTVNFADLEEKFRQEVAKQETAPEQDAPILQPPSP